MDVTESTPAGRLQRLREFRHQHAKAEIAAFFAAGFLFDIFTLSRIDDVFALVQQCVYLVILTGLMILEERYRAGVAAPPRLLVKAWRFSEDAIHFLFGSLLSSFTLFYLKSSSGIASFVFMAILGALLVANELPVFRERGPIVRFALLSLCLTSYLALLLPILLGFLSKWLFVTAVVLACGALVWLVRSLSRWTGDAPLIRRHVAGPAFGMQALLVAVYFAGAIPPVPLSVQFIGIYHEVVPPGAQQQPEPGPSLIGASLAGGSLPDGSLSGGSPAESAPEGSVPDGSAPDESVPGESVPDGSVSGGSPPGGSVTPPRTPRTAGAYLLKHERPWWKLWQNGDQHFLARPGDVVYCFARVFAPNRFRDAIYVHWWLKGRRGWVDQGRAQLNISGGRGDGFRAFATKKNYQPGRWRVEVETDDGRDIGVIHFDLVNDLSTNVRDFAIDRH
jgi:DUF2914 family protein